MLVRLKHAVEELKARNVRKIIAIYTSTGLTAVGMVKLFSEVYHLPSTLFTIVVVFLTCGFASAFVIAWYHGAGGDQRIRKREIVFHTLLLLLAIALSIHLVGAPGGTPSFALDAKSIAVLPFKNMSDSKEDEYFSDGMTEDIITQLSKIGDLQVISRTSVMKYKDTQKTSREIGEELGAAAILEGSVRRAGQRVRIVGQLIDAKRDQHLWAETYDRELKDIFAIQSEVAQNIAASLRATLSPGELNQITKKPTDSIDAYAYYLRGRDYYYQYTKENNERAIGLFAKALAIDAHFALAYAGLGDAYERRYTVYEMDSTWADSAIAASTIAISLDPDLAEGYKALGNAFYAKGQLRRALELFTKAVKLNPNYAPAVNNVGWVSWSLGTYDEALKWMKKASVLQPGFPRWSANVGLQYFMLGYDSLSLVWFHKALDLQPDYVFPDIILSYLYIQNGKIDSARASIARALSIDEREYLVLDAAGDIELLARNFEGARKYYERSVALFGQTRPSGFKLAYVLHELGKLKESEKITSSNLTGMASSFEGWIEGASDVPYFIAGSYAWRGDPANAIRWLDKAMELGYGDFRWISVDPQFNSLRKDTGFQERIARLRTRYEAMRERVSREGLL
jgi:TolB-like protein/Tfp pilus assembly protein PilF